MRVFISRIIAPVIAALVGWLTSIGLDLDPGFGPALTEATTWLILAIFGAIYGIVHRLIDKKLNPGDVADPSRRATL